MSELKGAMKSRNTAKSTVIRSILAEVYAADKAPGRAEVVPSSTIYAILRKAVQRRAESAAEFEKASRSDLAQKEQQEAELLQSFLPPLLPEAEIDHVLRDILAAQPQPAGEGNAKKALGNVYKAFYAKVDRSLVNTDLVRERAEALLSETSS
ncbi:GatB/YqeY domain-containing protein [Wolfiporia cocos MD-104 SS10]|uniref:Altered inheritance of mitochondria protein 41 n=1 Tax=Wolfiporia cocos (strain MD-104) TaxID=742152 RepID=A0A2H3JMT3_WOLCO|nr:GatB/YqeY domain-containing protein [Wolfiporia cocos MD-104 SS10]